MASAASDQDLNGVLFEEDAATDDLDLLQPTIQEAKHVEWTYLWQYIFSSTFVHVAGLYGGYLLLVSAKWQTVVFAFLLCVASLLGVTAGTHRLWTHRAYKAKWPLQLLLIIFQTLALQWSAINWVRDHRMHHKYCETDADPHNSMRGFFFAHYGWLCVDKHPEYIRKSKDLDLSDLTNNPFLYFQQRYYLVLMTIVSIIMPTVTPVYLWNESWTNAFFVAVWFRVMVSYNITSLVNSAAHMWGNKPFDRTLLAGENISVSFFALGEGFHNYHHAFPWDYKTAELRSNIFNFSTTFIDFFAKIGWAYDLKTVSPEIVRKRVARTGDGSHNFIWGWGGEDQPKEEMDAAIRIYPKDD